MSRRAARNIRCSDVPGARRLPIEQPPWRAPVVGPQPPALAGSEIGEIEDRGAGAAQTVRRPDPAEIVERGVVAGQQEMVAVVDDEAQSRVEEGPAASSRRLRRLVHDRFNAGLGEAHRRAQAGDARADDMDGPFPHTTP